MNPRALEPFVSTNLEKSLMFKLFKTVNLLAALSLFLISGCATLPKDFERPESYAYTDTANTSFGKAISGKAAEHPGKSGFRLLGNGLDAFVSRALLAHFAEICL